MSTVKALRKNLTAESKAYGYTLCVWGTGALMITSYQALTPETILLYVLGGVLGFGVMAYVAFQSFLRQFEYLHEEELIVASTVHVLASFGTVLLSYVFINLLQGLLPAGVLGLLMGAHAVISYNVFLLVEDKLFREFSVIEDQLAEQIGAGQNV